MEKLSRRTFTRSMLGPLLTFSLVERLCAADALAGPVKPVARTPESLLSHFIDQLATPTLDSSVTAELASYLRATGPWTGSDAQLQVKAAGVVHLIAGSPEYQFV